MDVLIAARTVPGHSWANPAERVMSLLNLAYQNVALYREEINSSLEQIITSANTMSDIRKKKAASTENLKVEWMKPYKAWSHC